MKATTQPAKFQPIVLTLETEEEARAIFAAIDNRPLSTLLGIGHLPSPVMLGFPESLLDTELNVRISSALRK